MITVLIFMNVLIFFLDMFSPETGPDSRLLTDFLKFLPADLVQAPWSIWNLLSYGFAHSPIQSKESIFHVGGNMLILFFLGRPIEQRLGRWEFLKFYLVSIVVAGLGYLLYCVPNLDTAKAIVGASGAVSAVVALFIFYYPHQTLLLFGIVPIRAWLIGVILVGMDILRSWDPTSNIAWQAHLSGIAFGAAYYYFQWNFHWLRGDRWQKLWQRRSPLKIHRPDKSETLRVQADAILKKINEQGEQSLTPRERRLLKQYSEQLRKQRS